jgi:2,4-dienoyl-CoA reductase-like NADH-dependent reductase (Old Yellow Enzyme family)
LITDAKQAEEIVASGKAGFGAIARAILYDPRSRWHAAVLARVCAWKCRVVRPHRA